MNKQWVVLVLLVLGTNFAFAASFDCDKAGTEVETMICADPELSKLDEELSAAYSKALKESSDPTALKQQQRFWLKDRNECEDIACLNASYQRRITIFQAEQSSSVASKETTADTKATANGYPPYPDVWEMHFPTLVNNLPTKVRDVMLDNGDVWFGFVSPERTKDTLITGIPLKDFSGNTFFSQQTSAFNDKNELLFSNGIKINAIEDESGKGYPGTAELSNGNYIISSQGTFYRGCYQGPAANQLTRYKSKVTKELLQSPKVVFLLLDEPISISTGSVDGVNRHAACEVAEQTVTTRIVSMHGDIIPLKDGGFLLVDQNYGLIVRFDAHLNTQSKLLNRKIFVLDSKKLDSLFIQTITDKNYMDKRGWIKMQEAINDLDTYLVSLSKGEK